MAEQPLNEPSVQYNQSGQTVYGDQTNIAGNIYTGDEAYDVRGLENPYLGLKAFTYAERASYAGRDEEIGRALTMLTTPGHERTLLFVTGASGSGKSSFVQAGLLPALERRYAEQGYAVKWAVFQPGKKPLAGLANALYKLGVAATGCFVAAAPYQVAGLVNPAPAHQVALLCIDQFEELFSQSEGAQREAVFALLANLPPFRTLRIQIVATLRADYLPELFVQRALYEEAKVGLDLRAMTADQLARAIERPLQVRHPGAGKRFQRALLKQLAADAAVEAAYLPLLQVTLEAIWQGGLLTVDSYTSLADAISQRADAILAQTQDATGKSITRSMEEQERILQIFLDLVEVALEDDTRGDVRRSRRLDDLTHGRRDGARLVRELATARLLSTSEKLLDNSGQPVQAVDIIHESLIGNWPRLGEAIQVQRERLQQRRRFELRLAEWMDQERAADYLLSGVYLAEAEALRGAGDVALQSPAARMYVAESVGARDRVQQAEIARERALAEAETRRARTFLWAAIIASLLLVVALIAGGWAVKREDDARISANIAATRAAEAVIAAHIAQAQALVSAAQLEAKVNPMRAWLLAIEGAQRANVPQPVAFINRQAPLMAQSVLTLDHSNTINGAQWSKDGNYVLSWSNDKSVRLWDVATGKQIIRLEHPDRVTEVQWNKSQDQVLSLSGDNVVRVWNIFTGQLLLSLPHKTFVGGALWNRSESRVLTWDTDNIIRIWDALTGDLLLSIAQDKDNLTLGAQWNYNSTHVLSWSHGGCFQFQECISPKVGTVKIWDANTGNLLLSFAHGSGAIQAQWNPNETLILTWAGFGHEAVRPEDPYKDNHLAKVWDAVTGDLLFSFAHTDAIAGAKWSRDGSRIVTWSHDKAAKIWDITTGRPLVTLLHNASVVGAEWSDDEALMLTWSEDKTARIWDAETGHLLHTTLHTDSVLEARWNHDSSRIWTRTALWLGDWSVIHETATIWDAVNGDPVLTVSHVGGIQMKWSPKENLVLSWSSNSHNPGFGNFTNGSDHTIRFWSAVNNDFLTTVSHGDRVGGMNWNSDESRFLTWGDDKMVKIWDAVSGRLVFSLGHEAGISDAQWNRDSSRILTQSSDNRVSVWDAILGRLLYTLIHHGPIEGARWNQDGSRILTWSGDKTARIWDGRTGVEIVVFAHKNAVRHAQWNEDESRVLTVSEQANVWDVDSGNLRYTAAYKNNLIGRIFGVKWDGANNHILIGVMTDDYTVNILDSMKGEPSVSFRDEDLYDEPLWFRVGWSNNSSRIFTWAYSNPNVKIWNTTTGKQLFHLVHGDNIYGVRWDASEGQILTWSFDGTAKIWDATNGQLLRTLSGDGSTVTDARWNQAENQVALTTLNGKVYRYFTQVDELTKRACMRATRNLTWFEWQQYLLGEPYRQTCLSLPIHPSVPPDKVALVRG